LGELEETVALQASRWSGCVVDAISRQVMQNCRLMLSGLLQ
jgi:hypothetical protein